ncbi:hypothetical protein, partial [Neobacillus drentensis]|uniref:hypothetical protein n=1 Tax=Neobacillus drentensis TaxID=220684 RepID=UPI002FFF4FAE
MQTNSPSRLKGFFHWDYVTCYSFLAYLSNVVCFYVTLSLFLTLFGLVDCFYVLTEAKGEKENGRVEVFYATVVKGKKGKTVHRGVLCDLC